MDQSVDQSKDRSTDWYRNNDKLGSELKLEILACMHEGFN